MTERTFSLTSDIYYARDSLVKATPFLSSLGKRFVIITESVLRTETHTGHLRGILKNAGIDSVLYDDISSPNGELPVDIVKFVRSSRADAVIGFGGMRTLGLSRWAALQAQERVAGKNAGTGLPFVALPSTCRNPFLFSPVWYFSFPGKGSGVHELSGSVPAGIILDPVWFRTLPPRYAGTAVLASILDSVEGLFSRHLNTLSEALFLQSVAVLSRAIPGGMSGGDSLHDPAGTGGLLSAAGYASVDAGPIQICSFILEARHGVPKAWTASVLLPHLLEFLAEEHGDLCSRIAGLLGEMPSRSGEPASHAAMFARDLVGGIDMPFRFTDFGLSENDLKSASLETFRFMRNSGLSGYIREEDLSSILLQAS